MDIDLWKMAIFSTKRSAFQVPEMNGASIPPLLSRRRRIRAPCALGENAPAISGRGGGARHIGRRVRLRFQTFDGSGTVLECLAPDATRDPHMEGSGVSNPYGFEGTSRAVAFG